MPPAVARALAGRRGTPGASKNVPSAMAASIRGRSWSTGRPAPRLRWPTSELPIWPGGRPTASSEAPQDARAASRASRPRQVGIGAAAMASPAGSRPIPNPSRTTRTMGRGRVAAAAVGHAAVSRRGRGRAAVIAGAGHDPGHLVGLERGAADERAVDRRLGQELADVGRGDAAAVQDRASSRRRSAQPERRRGVSRIASAIAAASRAAWRCGRCRSPRPARRR